MIFGLIAIWQHVFRILSWFIFGGNMFHLFYKNRFCLWKYPRLRGVIVYVPSIPYISISIFDRFGNELGTLSMASLCTCMQCMERPGPVYSFLWQMWHLKCFAFWCWMRIFSSSNSRLQYLNPVKANTLKIVALIFRISCCSVVCAWFHLTFSRKGYQHQGFDNFFFLRPISSLWLPNITDRSH